MIVYENNLAKGTRQTPLLSVLGEQFDILKYEFVHIRISFGESISLEIIHGEVW